MIINNTVTENISGNAFGVPYVRTVLVAIGVSTDHPQNACGPGGS